MMIRVLGFLAGLLLLGSTLPAFAASPELLFHVIESQSLNAPDDAVLRHSAVTAMLDTLDDPHAQYISPQMYKAFQGDNLFSIGIRYDIRNGIPVVTDVHPQSPAGRAGLRVHDQIVAINQQNTQGSSIYDIDMALLGPLKSKVMLSVRRSTQGKLSVLPITRESYRYPAIAQTQRLGANIAYLRLAHFSKLDFDKLESILQGFKTQDLPYMILDLRHNNGGSFQTSMAVADLFIGSGIMGIVRTQHSDQALPASTFSIYHPKKLLIIVNQHTGSAAEMLAASLRDHYPTQIIGTPTIGKSSIQKLFPLDEDDAVILTIAEFLPPSKRPFSKTGLRPDVPLDTANTIGTSPIDRSVQYAIRYFQSQGMTH